MLDIVMHIVTWGERCNSAMEGVLLPSIIMGESKKFCKNLEIEISTDNIDDIESRLKKYFGIFKSIKLFGLKSQESNRHLRVSKAEQEFVKRSVGKIMLFITPDMMPAKGSFSFCVGKIMDKDYEMVVTSGLRTYNDTTPPIGATPTELTKWCYANMHHYSEREVWGNVPCYDHASILLFKCPAGYVIRAFHLHPIAVRHMGGEFNFSNTIDDDLLSNIKPEKTHVITDSRKAFFIEQSPRDMMELPILNRPLSKDDVETFSKRPYIRDINRFLFMNRIIHYLDENASTDAEDMQLFPQFCR